jgi:hypothetical protein
MEKAKRQPIGVHPFNSGVFFDEAFLSSEVINRYQGHLNEDKFGETNNE